MRRIKTVMAVIRKEFIMMVRYPTWIIQLVIWPLIFPLMYILSALGFSGPDRSGLQVFAQNTGTGNYAAYIIIGTMTWMWVNTIMWTFGSYLRQEQMLGTLESNWLCPVKKFDFLCGAAFVSIGLSLFMTAISVVEYKLFYNLEFTGSIISWLLVFLAMVPGIYGFATCFASLVLWIKESNSAVHVVRGVMMILCGITFPISITPTWMQECAKLLPFTYGIQAARDIMVFGKSLSEAQGSLIMTISVGMIYLLLGRLSFAYTERKVKMQGSLGRY